ncbi:MAG: hypothetical protein KIT09_19330 [Bryobacteraceae bacterium]|nr:hypothetical protein [Bryobacteraceae bacterium]
MRASVLLLAALASAAYGQRTSEFEGLRALALENDKLELLILTDGGAMASLVLKDDAEKLNPMWNPARLAREMGQQARRMGATGHFVCVDGFGPVSKEERAAGLPGHGEAVAQPWETVDFGKSGNVTSLTLRANLPLVQETLTRRYAVADGENVVRVDSVLGSLLGFDRPAVWAEHATIGSPFLAPEVTVVDLAPGPSQVRPYPPDEAARHRLASGKDFTWPMAPTNEGKLVDVRAAPANPDLLDHTTTLLDTARELAFVTALNLEKRLLIGYLFRREEFPWLQIWEHYPQGRTLARGLEFSTQPYDVPRRESISLGAMFGAPTYRWLPARSKITSRFLLFFAQAPEGMKKVDDVRWEKGTLIVEDRESGARLSLSASQGL